MLINYDLENSPLQIRTDSEVGSGERVSVSFHTEQGALAGGVSLDFKASKYQLADCIDWTNFPTDLPSETHMIWTITLSKSSGVRSIMITCNNNEFLHVVLSETSCWDRSRYYYWFRDVEKIEFSFSDTASDHYRPG